MELKIQLLETVTDVSAAVQDALDALLAVDDDGDATVNATAIAALDLTDFESAVDGALGKIGNYSQRLNAKQDFLSSCNLEFSVSLF